MSLLTEWCSCGFSPDTFWSQTFRTYQAAVQGGIAASRHLHNNAVKTAYLTAVFSRAKAEDVNPNEFFVDAQTGETLAKSAHSQQKEIDAQDALAEWFDVFEAIKKKA